LLATTSRAIVPNMGGQTGDAGSEAPGGWAYWLDGAGGGRLLDREEARHFRPEHGVLWLHLEAVGEGARDWLLAHEGLSHEECESLLREVTRTRVETAGDRLLVTLLVPRRTDEEMTPLRMSLQPRRVVTLFDGELPAVEEALARLARGQGPKDAPDLLLGALRGAIARSEITTLELDERLSDLEVDAEAHPSLALEHMRDVQRSAGAQRRGLARQREAIARIADAGPDWLTEGHESAWHDLMDRQRDLLATIDGLVERLRGLYDYQQGRQSDVINQRLYVLALVSAVVLPLTFITGLLGVNLAGIPAHNAPWAFPALCAVLAVLGIAGVVLFRRRQWLPREESEERPSHRPWWRRRPRSRRRRRAGAAGGARAIAAAPAATRA
jgi:zinc transporter